jgi:hypothetical protein
MKKKIKTNVTDEAWVVPVLKLQPPLPYVIGRTKQRARREFVFETHMSPAGEATTYVCCDWCGEPIIDFLTCYLWMEGRYRGPKAFYLVHRGCQREVRQAHIDDGPVYMREILSLRQTWIPPIPRED